MPRYAVTLSDGSERVVEAATPEEAQTQVEASFTAETPQESAASSLNTNQPSSISPQEDRGIGQQLRDWFTNLASERRVAAQEQANIGDVGRDPGWADLSKAGLAGGAALATGGLAGAPVRTLLSLLAGTAGAKAGGAIGESMGEAVGPGVGSLGREGGEILGGLVGGITPETGIAASSRFAPALRESSLRSYAQLLDPSTEAETATFAKDLAPIAEKLPWLGPVNPRKRLERVAEAEVKPAGEAVGKLYNVDTPSSFKPAIESLRKLAGTEELGSAPAHRRFEMSPEGDVYAEFVPAAIKNEPFHKALQKRIAETKSKQARSESAQEAGLSEGVTIKDIYESRQTADTLAKQAASKVFDPSKKARDLAPKPRALKAERTALKDILHSEVKGGKEADAIFSAWSSLKEAGQQKDPGNFLYRWFAGRSIPGPAGTTAGYFAAQPAFWHAAASNTKRAMARALEQGKTDEFSALLRTAVSAYAANKDKADKP